MEVTHPIGRQERWYPSPMLLPLPYYGQLYLRKRRQFVRVHVVARSLEFFDVHKPATAESSRLVGKPSFT